MTSKLCQSPSVKINLPHTFTTLPNYYSINIIGNNLSKLAIKTVTSSSKTIRDLLHSSPRLDIVSEASDYCISGKSKYTAETSRKIQKHLFAFKRDFKVGNLNNALLQDNCKSVTTLIWVQPLC